MTPRLDRRVPMEKRFWAKVAKTDDCWEWTGAKKRDGYGKISLPGVGKTMLAHRYSAMLHFGMFDTRLFLCHHCDNPGCVRPDHLFLGDAVSNMRDMVGKRRHGGFDTRPGQYEAALAGYRTWQSTRVLPTACRKGHEFTPENVLTAKDGIRRCRECNRLRSAARRASRG